MEPVVLSFKVQLTRSEDGTVSWEILEQDMTPGAQPLALTDAGGGVSALVTQIGDVIEERLQQQEQRRPDDE